MSDQATEDYGIKQDHEKGPGLFLKLSYVVIVIFCIYYLFAYFNWKSSYDLEMDRVNQQMQQK